MVKGIGNSVTIFGLNELLGITTDIVSSGGRSPAGKSASRHDTRTRANGQLPPVYDCHLDNYVHYNNAHVHDFRVDFGFDFILHSSDYEFLPEFSQRNLSVRLSRLQPRRDRLGFGNLGIRGWVIALYRVEGLYLFALGVATGLYAIFNLYANWRSAVMLSAGIVTAGFSLFSLFAAYTDFLPRCFVEVGCNPALARSTAFDLVWLGLLLAFATFIAGYGTASFRKR
jgi:hypothetical protein